MNNDLISRSGLGVDYCNPDVFENKAYAEGWNSLIKIIKEAPTIDAVEVVRCRDCLNCGMKASIKYDGYRDDVRLCMLHGIAVLPNDYCSGGVKMDAEVEG